MNETIFYTLASVAVISGISLVGVLTLAKVGVKRLLPFLVSLAVGALFGSAIIHLIPEGLEKLGDVAPYLILFGLFLFFAIEHFLLLHHEHNGGESEIHPVGWLNIIGDAFHNFLDGMIVAAAYMVDINVGLAATVAVILHEIPQELGDFGVLVHAGFKPKKALLLNLGSALAAVVGALVVLFGFGPGAEVFAQWVVPVAAGGFLYIAGSDLVPQLHEFKHRGWLPVQSIGIIVGLGAMIALAGAGI